MTTTFSFGTVPGLTGDEQRQLTELTEAYNYHQSRNATKDKYYEGHVTLQDVNLGIALPKGLNKLEVGCNWGQKAVDALASRSMFDGFVSNGGALDGLQKLVADNRLIAAYAKACRDQLKYGCVFATLSADTDIGCRIRFHSPATASALWNGEKGRIDCGLAIIDTVQDEHQKDSWRPALVNFYTDTDVIVLRSNGSSWTAERTSHRMGRPLMEPLIWNATSNKPFGRSRLKRAIRSLIDDYVRTVANATIALEFDTTPQKYILGVTDEQYDAITSDKFKQYVGALIAATSNPETGENPVFGQLAAPCGKDADDRHPVCCSHRPDRDRRGRGERCQPHQQRCHSCPEPDAGADGAATEHRQRRCPAHHRLYGAGHCPKRIPDRADRGRARRDGALQKPRHAQRGGDCGRCHQDRNRPAGVRQHRHLSGDDRLRSGGYPAYPGTGAAGARAGAADGDGRCR